MRNLKIFIAIVILFLTACSKDPIEYVMETYNNRAGLWDYCTYQSNEIDTQMKLVSTEIILSDTTPTDRMEHIQVNCPRNGVMVYTVQVVYKQ